MDISIIWTIGIIILLIAVGAAIYLWKQKKSQHWQVGYVTLRASKPSQAPRYETGFGEPIWGQQQTQQNQKGEQQQQNQGNDVQLPPGMF